MADMTTTIGCLQSVSIQTGGLDQAESVAGAELQSGAISQAQSDAVVKFVQNEDACGPGSFALAEKNLKVVTDLWA